MRVCTTIEELREARMGLTTDVGFVPTMGALHDGHLELVRRAKSENRAVIVSIFVNPTQFTSADDFQHYPRNLDADLAKLEAASVALAFVPQANELYPDGFATTIDVGPVATPFEGTARPGHFQGVATVVAMLFNIVQPTRAYFGQKDFQQVLVVQRLVADLRLPIEIVAVPTVRDADGLALSSRNALLTPEERASAVAIPRGLRAAEAAWRAGERGRATLVSLIAHELCKQPDITIEYLSLVDPATLSELPDTITGDALALIAVGLGNVRLIDNCLLETPLE